MAKSVTETNQPSAEYPTATDNPTTGKRKKFWPQTQTRKKGDRGFIEGCLFALCCCWICEACF